MTGAIRKFFGTVALAACVASLSGAANATTITTTFAGGNQYDGNFFNVTTNANSLTVTGMAVNVDPASMVIDVYGKSGTYSGFETNSSAWTLLSQTSVTGQGEGVATPVAITPFVLAANALTGLYVTIDTNVDAYPFMYYTNGANTYSNSDLTITTGEGSGGLFGSLGIYNPRTWNGSITYTIGGATTPVPEPSTLALFGAGLVGLLGFGLMRRRKNRVG